MAHIPFEFRFIGANILQGALFVYTGFLFAVQNWTFLVFLLSAMLVNAWSLNIIDEEVHK